MKIQSDSSILMFVFFCNNFLLLFKKKYPKIQNYFIVLLSVLISFSPSFRSLSIWPNGINLGLIFFLLSIYFFS